MNNLVARMKRQDPKEVSIYLFHSLSNSIITQLRQDENGNTVDQARNDKDILIRKIRRTSEEVCDIAVTYRHYLPANCLSAHRVDSSCSLLHLAPIPHRQ